MAEEFLNRADIIPVLKQMGGKFSIQPPGEVSHLGVPTPVAVRSGNQLTLKLKAKLLPSLGCDLVQHRHQVFFEYRIVLSHREVAEALHLDEFRAFDLIRENFCLVG